MRAPIAVMRGQRDGEQADTNTTLSRQPRRVLTGQQEVSRYTQRQADTGAYLPERQRRLWREYVADRTSPTVRNEEARRVPSAQARGAYFLEGFDSEMSAMDELDGREETSAQRGIVEEDFEEDEDEDEADEDEDEDEDGSDSDASDEEEAPISRAPRLPHSRSNGWVARSTQQEASSSHTTTRTANTSRKVLLLRLFRSVPEPIHGTSMRRQPCSLLSAGSRFSGCQSLTVYLDPPQDQTSQLRVKEEWLVSLEFEAVDFAAGTVYGRMRASHVPNASVSSIVTLFEGEILDHLLTGKWNATVETDVLYWRKLSPFRMMEEGEALQAMARCRELCHEHVFMRMKETAFGDAKSAEAGLTISGFYYASVRRSDGKVEGLYFDPHSAPLQKLLLRREDGPYQSAAVAFR
ncbi:vacuolar import and degradation protein-domain-containing protein [Protomyces lactucae-debilis]|uniref:Vacuolar import and degradation protein-domain-containing protein n=1 Tax=Protomyces lactucae-debilis TaxID=2754530 RepID=A0A1Y2FES9_PROLT|nr:vacuolar import and degradation protein-domain-containing protein [Protomyces lactucae-debilis]ORY82117.1 vacuolar import and degradation protein-domain-containing protein [Protomyces lactucae-debilis]